MRGGYTNLIYSSKLANKFGIKIAPHMFPELSIHIVASIENPSWLEYMGWYDHLWKEPLLPKNGTLTPTSVLVMEWILKQKFVIFELN